MKINFRTEVAGIEVKVRGQKHLDALFKRLGGRVLEVSDKGVYMEFPSASAAEEFKTAAKARGAIIDRVEEGEL